MSKENLRIIFMGTPEFAVPSLQVLIDHGYHWVHRGREAFRVVAVVTAPDKPQGRGKKILPSPVKQCAVQNNIPVLQPANLKSQAFLEELQSYQANLQVVVAFRMLPEAVWNMPSKGTFNLHASLLPQYRGAAPINWAVINGETETGVTTFMIRHEIDTGNMLFQEKEPISHEDTAGSLYERLMHKGSRLVLKTVEAIAQDNYQLMPQEENNNLKPAPKIHRETCQINWNQPAETIRNFIRGLSPYPAAWTILPTQSGEMTCKIFEASLTEIQDKSLKPGAVSTDNKTFLYVQTSTLLLSIDALQMQGKKKLTIQDFLRGNSL